MPENGERSTVLGSPVQQSHELRLGALRREPEVALFRKRGVHRRERDLDEIEWLVPLEVPRAEGTGDPGAETECDTGDHRDVGSAAARRARRARS